MKKKLIASLLTGLLIIGVIPIGASAEWKQDTKGWWYSEGNSYIKNQWKEVNGKWYYFNWLGYMAKNEIVDGYYLNSTGAWSNGTEEIQAYQKVLINTKLLKEKYNVQTVTKTDIVDIDKDGIYEALVDNGDFNSISKTLVFTYKNGEIQFVGDIGDITYYCEDKKALFGSKLFAGVRNGSIYNLENGKLNVIHNFGIALVGEGHYSIDDKKVTKEQLNNFLKQYGAIDLIVE